VKNAITAFLMMVAVAISPLGQNAPAEKPTPDKRIRVSERVLDNIVLKKVLPQPPGATTRHTRRERLLLPFWLTTMGGEEYVPNLR
jgi:hypothetical protein